MAEVALPGTAAVTFSVTSGVRQGCPCSSTLFVLALEPWLVLSRRALPFPTCLWSAYADDLALTLRSLFLHLRVLQSLIRILRFATAMALAPRKSVIVPLFDWADDAAIRRRVTDVAPALGGMQIACSAKYLGVQVGPGAAEVFWDAATRKYWSRLLDECQVHTGMADRIRRYARRVFPVLRYLLQFRAPSPSLLALEGRPLQRLVAGPWQTIPTQCMRRLDLLRLPAPPSLASARRADSARVILTTPAVWEALERGQPTGDDLRLAPRCHGPSAFVWHEIAAFRRAETDLLAAHVSDAGGALAKQAKKLWQFRTIVD